MAYQQHRAAKQYREHRTGYCSALAAPPEQKKACEEEGASAKEYLPWGYELFVWPEGVTAWAIIATGFVIAWQAVETRKAANATKNAAEATRDAASATSEQVALARRALMLEFRPKLVFRGGTVEDSSNIVTFWVTNIGSSEAHVSRFQLSFIVANSPDDRDEHFVDMERNMAESVTFAPGETKRCQFTMASRVADMIGRKNVFQRMPIEIFAKDLASVYCTSGLWYKDGLGIERGTEIVRKYKAGVRRFVAFNGTRDAEYAD